jgi:hypothetical protein
VAATARRSAAAGLLNRPAVGCGLMAVLPAWRLAGRTTVVPRAVSTVSVENE